MPKILGGDKKAMKLAERLYKLSKIDGLLSMAMIYFKNENNEMFNNFINDFFEELSYVSICEIENSKNFFHKNQIISLLKFRK